MQQTCRDSGTPVEEVSVKVQPQLSVHRDRVLELDMLAIEMRLPENKPQQLRKQVHKWRVKKAVSKKAVLSLVGFLQHACKVVHPVHEG